MAIPGLPKTAVSQSRSGPTWRRQSAGLAAVLAVLVFGCFAARADAFVYWTQGVAVGRANLDGSDAAQSFIAPVGLPQGLAVGGQYVYWANTLDDSIGRANIDGSGVDQSFITGADVPEGVAVDGQHIYWTNTHGTIGRANLDGSGVDQSFITGADAPQGVAVDGQHVYWTNAASNTIGRANLDGSAVDQSFVSGAGVPEGVAVDAQDIYWTNINGTIGRANLDGSGVDQSFITGADAPIAVAVDGQHIYWANAGTGAIGRASLDSSNVDQNFITGAQDLLGVAVDALPLAPRASITTPAGGATYRVGQVVTSSFTCNEGAGGPGIGSCLDQRGRPSGTAIDTSTTGAHTFTVTAISNDGQTATATETYTVAARPANPVLADLRGSHARWREGNALPQITSRATRTPRAPAVGTRFTFTLNEPATVKLTFIRHASGRLRAVTAATLRLRAPRGTDQIRFAGRVSPTTELTLGSYTTTITATNASGETSRPKRLRFTIIR